MINVSSFKIKGVKNYQQEINQLYHPSAKFGEEFSIVYSKNNINTTKFSPILLKEWFYLLKKDGYLVIDYKENELLDWRKLERIIRWLWKGKYKIVFHGSIKPTEQTSITENRLLNFIGELKNGGWVNGGFVRFIVKKNASLKIHGDDITKWSFGIITRGERDEWVKKIIDSIRDLKIPKYEIVICGIYKGKIDNDIELIRFNKRDKFGWITKKSNLIVDKAKYENICIIHDRLIFDKNWFKGMLRWGNNFEFLGCIQIYNGKRAGDWMLSEDNYITPNKNKVHKTSDLYYLDWHQNAFISGNLHIGKKKYLKNAWNEALYWNDDEDVALNNELKIKGIIPRFNPYSRLNALFWRFKPSPVLGYDNKRYTTFHKGNFLVRSRIYLIYNLFKYISFFYNKIMGLNYEKTYY